MTIHQPELVRQQQNYRDVRARLMGKPEPRIAHPKPIMVVNGRKPVDVSYHVTLYRNYMRMLRERFVMAGSFSATASTDYCPYKAEIMFTPEPLPAKTMRQVALEVLASFPGVTLEDLLGPKRANSIVYPRHLAMYEIWTQRKDLSFPMIGRFFNRDHTSCYFAIRKMRALLDKDPESIEWAKNKTRVKNGKI